MERTADSRILGLHIPRYEELPTMGLYLEQLLSIVNQELAPICADPITGAMISNYIKNRAIPSPEKKKYYREHLCYALVTCMLKQVFSVQQIAALFQIQRDTYPLHTAYDHFCAEFENALKEAFRFTGGALPLIETKRTGQTVLVRAAVLSAANQIYVSKALEQLSAAARAAD